MIAVHTGEAPFLGLPAGYAGRCRRTHAGRQRHETDREALPGGIPSRGSAISEQRTMGDSVESRGRSTGSCQLNQPGPGAQGFSSNCHPRGERADSWCERPQCRANVVKHRQSIPSLGSFLLRDGRRPERMDRHLIGSGARGRYAPGPCREFQSSRQPHQGYAGCRPPASGRRSGCQAWPLLRTLPSRPWRLPREVSEGRAEVYPAHSGDVKLGHSIRQGNAVLLGHY